MRTFPLAAVGALLAGVAIAAPAHADPVYPPSYGSSGTFAVGTQTRDGLTAFIPPGHYTVTEAPGNLFKAPGFWLRCNGVPCTPTHPDHIIGNGDVPDSVMVDILPTDAAVYLYNVTLTRA